jgi:hypothetical protein
MHANTPLPGRRLRRRWPGGHCLAALLLLAPGLASATPLISELFYDATGSDDGQVFVELSGTPGTLLDGMTLEGVNGSGGGVGPVITLSGSIASDGLFVIADRTSSGSSMVGGADQLANFDFQNGPDSVVLRTSGGVAVDALGYGSFGAGDVFAGEGSSAPDAPAGSSLSRFFADIDTDDNGLDFEVLSMPTPGDAVFANVPEPASGTLVMAGLGVLAAMRRQRVRVERS